MDPQAQLLHDVEAFLARSNMTPTAFGVKVINDGKIVSRLRSGANMTTATIRRVQEFLSAHAALLSTKAP